MAVPASSRWVLGWNRGWAGGYRSAPASAGSSPPLPPAEASRWTYSFACAFPGSTSKEWEDPGSSSAAGTPCADTPQSDLGCSQGTWSWERKSVSSARTGRSSGSVSGSGFSRCRTKCGFAAMFLDCTDRETRSPIRQVSQVPDVVGLKQAIPRETDSGPVGGRDDVVPLPRGAFEGLPAPLQPYHQHLGR